MDSYTLYGPWPHASEDDQLVVDLVEALAGASTGMAGAGGPIPMKHRTSLPFYKKELNRSSCTVQRTVRKPWQLAVRGSS